MKKRMMVLVICLMMMVSSLPTHANNEPTENKDTLITVKNVDLRYLTNSLRISSSGKATATVYAEAQVADKIITYVYLKRYENGSWTTVKNWKDTEYSSSAYISESIYVVSGYEYKLFTNCYLYEDGLFIESVSGTSNSVYY